MLWLLQLDFTPKTTSKTLKLNQNSWTQNLFKTKYNIFFRNPRLLHTQVSTQKQRCGQRTFYKANLKQQELISKSQGTSKTSQEYQSIFHSIFQNKNPKTTSILLQDLKTHPFRLKAQKQHPFFKHTTNEVDLHHKFQVFLLKLKQS
jgi:hypothetical protein